MTRIDENRDFFNAIRDKLAEKYANDQRGSVTDIAEIYSQEVLNEITKIIGWDKFDAIRCFYHIFQD